MDAKGGIATIVTLTRNRGYVALVVEVRGVLRFFLGGDAVKEPSFRTCPKCYGRKYLSILTRDPKQGGAVVEHRRKCDKCGGSGRVRK